MERKEKSQSQSAIAESLEALLQAALARWQHAVDQDMPIVGAEAVEWLSEFIGEARRLLPHPPYALENHQTGEITRHEKFSLGRIVATPGALEAVQRAGQSLWDFLARHTRGDWGEVCEEDRQENELAL